MYMGQVLLLLYFFTRSLNLGQVYNDLIGNKMITNIVISRKSKLDTWQKQK